MSNKSLFFISLVGGLIVVGGAFWWLDPNRGIQPIQKQPLSVSVEIPLPKTVETQVASLVDNENKELSAPTPTIAVSEAAIPSVTQDMSDVAASDTPSASTSEAVVEDPQVVQDKEKLDKHYAEFAYIEYSGLFSTKKMATFHNNLNGEKEKVLEGGVIHGLQLDTVAEDHVMLSYGKSGSIRKPRVDFDVKNDPNETLSEADKKARMLRYQELFGNRFRIAAKEADPEGKERTLRLPSDAEQQKAQQKYRETYGLLFERMSKGDPTIDFRDVPNSDLNFDEAIKRYFETNWPGQVEVSTEGEASSTTTPAGGTSEK